MEGFARARLASVAKHHLELEKHIISSSGLNGNPDVSKVLARTMEAIIGARARSPTPYRPSRRAREYYSVRSDYMKVKNIEV